MLEQQDMEFLARMQQKLGLSDESQMKNIRETVEFVKDAHQGQKRLDGTEYYLHPLAVAEILTELNVDESTIIASLLHDVVEDCNYTLEDITDRFGAEVAALVDGITKLGKLDFSSKEEHQAENFRKMFMAMAKDIRVILIKFADRLHNMRTLSNMNDRKQLEKAYETLEIFAPLAHRLGINRMKWELEDLAFQFLEPDHYYDLAQKVNMKREEREAYITRVIDEIRSRLQEEGFQAEIHGRAKHLYSIHNKINKENKRFEEIYDLMAVRIIVNTVQECYACLGIIHTMWKPMPDRFKDYIALPKPNMYQSLHTTVMGEGGLPFEVQIRTQEMHRVAEYGIAAHFMYKEGANKKSNFDQKLTWLREMLEWQNETKDAKEFMDRLKIDLFEDEVFVFTPKGDVINLPKGSTPLDFAYHIHTEIGHRCVGARVKSQIVPLTYTLKTGDIVEIMTGPKGKGPSRDWIGVVFTTSAKNKIRTWFKKEKREENIEKGLEMLEEEARKEGYRLSELLDGPYIETLYRRFSIPNDETLFETVGYGGMVAAHFVKKLVESYRAHTNPQPREEELINSINKGTAKKQTYDHGVVVEGLGNIKIKLAHCCNPINGDPIIGYVTRGRGVSVHRRNCPNVKELLNDKARIIECRWASQKDEQFEVHLMLQALNRNGIITDVITFLNDGHFKTLGMNAKATKDGFAMVDLAIQVASRDQMQYIISNLSRIRGVIEVSRLN